LQLREEKRGVSQQKGPIGKGRQKRGDGFMPHSREEKKKRKRSGEGKFLRRKKRKRSPASETKEEGKQKNWASEKKKKGAVQIQTDEKWDTLEGRRGEPRAINNIAKKKKLQQKTEKNWQDRLSEKKPETKNQTFKKKNQGGT